MNEDTWAEGKALMNNREETFTYTISSWQLNSRDNMHATVLF